MKLRIRGNSIRFRLTRSEVESFATQAMIEEVVGLSPQNFSYALEKVSAQNLSVTFENGKISVFVPIIIANQWTNGEQVSMEGNDGGLRILIEKDFACLNPRKDELDNFPHPLTK
ncbi:hypothetical protein BH10ACI1_BH10ACI1_33610 [soil metagenome]